MFQFHALKGTKNFSELLLLNIAQCQREKGRERDRQREKEQKQKNGGAVKEEVNSEKDETSDGPEISCLVYGFLTEVNSVGNICNNR